MDRPDIETFGRKVQQAQHDLDRLRGKGRSGDVHVTVDAAGKLLSVSAADEVDIIAAYEDAVASITDQVEAATRAVREDPLSQTISSLVDASNAVKQAARVEQEDTDGLAYEAMRRDPLGWRRQR
ncbi:hypothetical protein GOARA_082_00870 [Gordonia araii NBRC 100433]|uniref:YbaB/EbfC DNA-binding family protein n=1 Tax=Gordonia araii NBRC 100433 TaxID=1073574 RepID=G7H773_9ACTN|nr:YbaB/EbfC family nucleoid-associated protein [Gordonia araii]NNG97693.1 YbaB/EbfC family nucleoid-associated protein [Gordonia araii NBRC 100433]GAB11698.1 hypothetical protein GOARA_082_00870 [Gordonia araii NBRC 100433]